jgi:phosphate/sulfate permease
MLGLDLLIVLGVIAAVLLLQPLIFLLYAYVVYKLILKYTRKQAGKAIDGRIDHAANRFESVFDGGSDS